MAHALGRHRGDSGARLRAMAREHTVEGHATSAAGAGAVWSLLADTAGWTGWAGFDEARRTRDGAPEPEGVGAHRLFLSGKVRNEEEIVRFEPGKALGYKVIAGNLPFREYRSEVTLDPAADGGTSIRWRSTYRAEVAGLGRADRAPLRAIPPGDGGEARARRRAAATLDAPAHDPRSPARAASARRRSPPRPRAGSPPAAWRR